MHKISTWKLAQKLQASNKRGLIIGLVIGVLICLVAAAVIVKICCLKKKFECMYYDMDCECDCDEDCEQDENGCTFTSDRDFV